MKPSAKIFLSFLFLGIFSMCTSLYVQAQQVSRAEYFIDTDPGFGKAQPVAVGSGADQTLNFQVNIAGVDAGFHRLYVRGFVAPYRDSANGPLKGGWSLSSFRSFYKEEVSMDNTALPNVIQGEYFVNTDPGFGKGTHISLTPSTDLSNVSFAVNITSLQPGFNKLYARFRDANGVWGIGANRSFYKEEIATTEVALPNINKGEYYFDTDPGFGKGTNIGLTPGKDLNNVSFVANISSLNPGFHRMYARFQDAQGNWGSTLNRTFYKEEVTLNDTSLSPIVKGEYFIDTDPGFGKGTNISLSSGTHLTAVNFTADISSIGEGFHRLYTRFRNAAGLWSITTNRTFYKEVLGATETLGKVVALEYFIDTDPGFGKGKPIAVTPSPDIKELLFEVDMTDVSIGNHQLYVRARDEKGAWSITNVGTFKVEATTDLIITVGAIDRNLCAGGAVNVPYRVNAPFGTNNIFTAQLSDANGSFRNPVNIGSKNGRNNDTIKATIPANMAAGSAYRIRIIANSPADTSGANTGNLTINRVPEASFNITGKNQSCLGTETYTTNTTPTNVTHFAWTLSGGGTLDTSGATATVQWTQPGNHTLTLQAFNACGGGFTALMNIGVSAIAPTQTPVLTASGRNLFASSNPPGADPFNTIEWYLDGTVISGASGTAYTVPPNISSGTYSVRYRNSCGVGPESNKVAINGDKQNQAITFTAVPDKTFGDRPFRVQAVASSGLPLVYSIQSGPGTILGDSVTITGAGTIVVKAFQEGNATYNSAEQTISVLVQRKPATITLSNLSLVYTGSPRNPTATTNPAGLAVSFGYAGGAVPVNAGKYAVTATITDANHTGSATDSLTIRKAPQSITLEAIADKALNAAPFKVNASATSGLPVQLSISTVPTGIATLANDTITILGGGAVTVTAAQPGNNNYEAAESLNTRFNIGKAAQEIVFAPIPEVIFGAAPFKLQATANSGLPVSFRIVSGPATLKEDVVTLTNIGTVVVEATQAGNSQFDAATPVQRSFQVKAPVVSPDLTVGDISADKTTIAPGDQVALVWKIANIGKGQSPVNWSERIYLQVAGGTDRILLQEVSFANGNLLDSGAAVNRNLKLTVPSPLNLGDQLLFAVEVVPGLNVNEPVGARENNIAFQPVAVAVRKLLLLNLSTNNFTEGGSQPVSATISRTGSITQPLTIGIGFRQTGRWQSPVSVIIPAGQSGVSFTLAALENNIVEGLLLDTLTASASQFVAARAPLQLEDNDLASLTINNLSATITEGQSTQFEITTDLAPTQPLTVYLTSSNKRFGLPASVIIPAGKNSVPVTVSVPNNDVPEIDVAISVTAGAAGQNPATAGIEILDDDVPGLELVLQTSEISEGAGLYATKATLRRKEGGNGIAFTANISTDFANSLILPKQLTLGANETEKTFNVGVVDNTDADGQRTVSITASVFVASCGCSAPPASSGSFTAPLTVNDNDGAALTLTATQLTLPEGVANAGLLRITRNTGKTGALQIDLQSSDTTEARLPVAATIPDGLNFVDVAITTLNDNSEDGSKQVYFKAKATGYATGTVWVLVSDQNKPDLQIPSVQLPQDSVQAKALLQYNVSIRNTGFATAPAGVVVRGYLSKDATLDDSDSLFTEDVVGEAIPVGSTVQVVNAVQAPNKPGTYQLLFKVNPQSSLTELLLTNNTATGIAFTIKPDYTVTASVAPAYFLQGSSVPVSGKATLSDGKAATNMPVEVFVITDGLKRKVSANTDGNGDYTARFVPMPKEAGHYTVGASFPGLESDQSQDAFDILGVEINEGKIPQFRVVLTDTTRGTLKVTNRSAFALQQFTLAPVTLPGGAHIQFATLAQLGGGETVELPYTASGTTLSPTRNFDVGSLRAVASEGSIQVADIFYFCQAPSAYLAASIAQINTSVSSAAGQRDVQFTLHNKGVGATGKVQLSLPNVGFLSLVTPAELPSMESGDSTTVTLRFRATDDVPFEFPVKGSMVIAAANGNSFKLPFTFQKVSVSTGGMQITVTNQFTYYTEGAPKVKDALVQVKNYFTGQLYAEGLTNSDGIFLAKDVPEGKHRIVVTKEKHLPSEILEETEPGDTVNALVFLNYQAITFSWKVVPTAVQDEYDITLETKFETHVPVPVVTIDMPKRMPQLSGSETYAFNVILTNHGLITALDVKLSLPQDDPEYEFITNYTQMDLAAQQSVQVPVIMRRKSAFRTASMSGGTDLVSLSHFLGMNDAQIASVAKTSDGSCVLAATVVYWYKCNLSTGAWERGGVAFTISGRECSGGGGGGGGGGVDPETLKRVFGMYANTFPVCAWCPVIPNGEASEVPVQTEKKNCVQCLNELAQAILGCLGVDIPPDIKCMADTYANGGNLGDFATCFLYESTIGAGIGAIKDKAAKKIPYLAQLLCIKELMDAFQSCLESAENSQMAEAEQMLLQVMSRSASNTSAGGLLGQLSSNLQTVQHSYSAKVNWINEYFGDLTDRNGWAIVDPMIDSFINRVDTIPTDVQQTAITSLKGYDISEGEIRAFFSRWNRSVTARDANVLEPNAQYPNIINWVKVKEWSDSLIDAHNYAIDNGFSDINSMNRETRNDLDTVLNNQQNAVCATVTIQINQRLTMTREAFEGTLEIFNGHPTDAMDSLSVNILITDDAGVPSNGKFQIDVKQLTNLNDVAGAGQLESQGTGSVQFLFIPEKSAAPTEPVVYNFGGSVRYFDPYVQAMVTIPLNPVSLTVNPSPDLELHYFMERNILSDDPLTQDKVEPTVPAELAVMVENHGYGAAVNMSINSAQPKIVENEKGLAIEFKLIGSNLQGKPVAWGLTNINFGTLPPLETRIGQWYFTSSLLGKFVSYEASIRHLSSRGNPDLSLVRGVKIHELTRSILAYAPGEDAINDFLVNDIFDVNDLPDIIYFSQGKRTEKVYGAKSGAFDKMVGGPDYTNTLSVSASDTGWNFIRLPDPGNGRYELVSVTRNDGQSIPLRNAWLTFVTLPASKPPVYENKFHFVDSIGTGAPVSYTVVWKPKADNLPEVVRIEGVPEAITAVQVKSLRVVFNKAIDAATFTHDDLDLNFQGGGDLASAAIGVKQVDSATFDIDLSRITLGNGLYAFTVQTDGIRDVAGNSGNLGKRITWTQFLTIPTVQAFEGLPEKRVAASYDTIRVRFNLVVDSASVTPDRFGVFKDGTRQPGTVRIDSIHPDKKLYYLSGLDALLPGTGDYEFRVDLPNILSEAGVRGDTAQSIMLSVDRTGPVVLRMQQSNEGGLDSLHIQFVDIEFDEEVFDFNTASVKLTRNGVAVPVRFDQLTHLEGNNWRIGNLGMASYPEGTYILTLDRSAIRDAAGNSGVGNSVAEWTVDRSVRLIVSKLVVGPDLGFSNTDGQTSGDTLEVRFHLNEDAAGVSIYQTEEGSALLLKAAGALKAGNQLVKVVPATPGNINIRVEAIDGNDGRSAAQKAIYLDPAPITATWQFEKGQTVSHQMDTLMVQLSARLLEENALLPALQLHRNGMPLSTPGMQVFAVDDSLFGITGLRKAGTEAGLYELRLDLTKLRKYVTAKGGEGFSPIEWRLLSQNRAPVANAGPDLIVTTQGPVTLDATSSKDPDNDPVTYRWISSEGLALSDTASAQPTFNINAASQGKTYNLVLVVSDGQLVGTDQLMVKVQLPQTSRTFYRDADSDGYGTPANSIEAVTQPDGFVGNNRDCDDGDAFVHPGASEMCNGIDDNCDGQVDEGIMTTRYFLDADKDGWGDSAVDSASCVVLAGYVTRGGDCNDKDAAIHPEAVELCNGKDDNCDGQVDEDCTGSDSTFYRDRDGDGYGDATESITAATRPAGYVAEKGDCNDRDAQVYPGAPELCDGKDNNCNGQVDEGVSQYTYYRDADGDGYGTDETIRICSKTAPPFYARVAGDCNDNDYNIRPRPANAFPEQWLYDPNIMVGPYNAAQSGCRTNTGLITPPVFSNLQGYIVTTPLFRLPGGLNRLDLSFDVFAYSAGGKFDCKTQQASISCPVSLNIYLVDGHYTSAARPPASAIIGQTGFVQLQANKNNQVSIVLNRGFADGRNARLYVEAKSGNCGGLAGSQQLVIDNIGAFGEGETFDEICGNGIDDNCDGQIDEGCNVLTAGIKIKAPDNLQHLQLNPGDVDLELSLIATPNPSQHGFTLNIRGDNDRPATIRISDALGKLVEIKQNISVQITYRIGERYKPGVYFIELIQGSKKVVIKVVKVSG